MKYSFYTFSKAGVLRQGFNVFKQDKIKFVCKVSVFLTHARMLSKNHKEIIKVKKKTKFLKTSYEIYEEGALVGTVERIGTTFSKHLSITSPYGNYSIYKESLKSFVVKNDDLEVAKISRNVMKFKKHLGIAIAEGEHEEFILANLLVLHLVLQTYGTL